MVETRPVRSGWRLFGLFGVWLGFLCPFLHHLIVLGRPSVAGPVFARVFGPQTGVQKNHFFRSLEGAKSLENL